VGHMIITSHVKVRILVLAVVRYNPSLFKYMDIFALIQKAACR